LEATLRTIVLMSAFLLTSLAGCLGEGSAPEGRAVSAPIQASRFQVSAADADQRGLHFADGELATFATPEGRRIVVRARWLEAQKQWILTYVREADPPP
jgi:hypothetical protein